MDGKGMRAENIGELQIWIEGQFNLLAQSQNTTAEDVRQVRSRVHDLSNDLARLTALDIEGKFKRLEENDARHDTSITAFMKDQAVSRASIRTGYVVATAIGAGIGTFVTIALELWKAFHP